MKPSDERFELRQPSDFNINKLKDEMVRRKQVKYDVLCPLFAFYFECPNLILKDYCPYLHIEDCRKAYRVTMDYVERGQKPDLTH